MKANALDAPIAAMAGVALTLVATAALQDQAAACLSHSNLELLPQRMFCSDLEAGGSERAWAREFSPALDVLPSDTSVVRWIALTPRQREVRLATSVQALRGEGGALPSLASIADCLDGFALDAPGGTRLDDALRRCVLPGNGEASVTASSRPRRPAGGSPAPRPEVPLP